MEDFHYEVVSSLLLEKWKAMPKDVAGWERTVSKQWPWDTKVLYLRMLLLNKMQVHNYWIQKYCLKTLHFQPNLLQSWDTTLLNVNKTPCHNCPESLITHSTKTLYPLLPSLNKCNNLSPPQRHLQGEKLIAFWDVTVGEILYSERCTVPLSTVSLCITFLPLGQEWVLVIERKNSLGMGSVSHTIFE